MELDYFKTEDFYTCLRKFFSNLNIPVNYISQEPVKPKDILENTYKKDHPAFRLMKDVYFLGMVDDAAFKGSKSPDPDKIKSDYDGILIFGITLIPRANGLVPTRSQLAEISRSFNREYKYTPVVTVFKYENYIAFANTQRLKYKVEWLEGEKAGKVSLLRDIDLDNPHSGHLRILSELAITGSEKKPIKSFAALYTYWQDVFSVNILNKKFYKELSNWYFWAIKEVHFPSEPTVADQHRKKIDLAGLRHEHNAKNVIRLLTRFLFVWFIKEKKLIPEELFDLNYLKKVLLKDLSPVSDKRLFKEVNLESVYYKAILQNLFFATLNCPIKSNRTKDKRTRGFSKNNFGVLYLMRYKKYFKNADVFLDIVNNCVPFLNGGLFECLDKRGEKEKKEERDYIDGFSDNLPKEDRLIVPDHLFFGFDREVDLSDVVGIKTNVFKKASVKGLISILKSYKFTIAENTPIEEDVALDPELLGKVFENLLASYNPETKTTARKQTGSFYTPREIVNYMVDESLIAYLKNSVKNWNIKADELDKQLHKLLSFDNINPFFENNDLQKQIIHSLDNCKILDPACGSGAFPMGILQKMVHVLKKLDPKNKHWKALQLKKAVKETEGAFAITDKKERKQRLIEINEAFDQKINDPDYARKLFLVENCIYGVDIQPIAAQISKLRFFISLIVDQMVDKNKPNFGIRALPNLEIKFVAANTLILIDKTKANLFDNEKIKILEQELKNVRHRLFSAKSPATKRRLRDKDKKIREKMGELLVEYGYGNETAKQLVSWDPYDQNATSPFFNPEWMFGVKDGFDVVLGNPPYIQLQKFRGNPIQQILKNQKFKVYDSNGDIYCLFYENGINFLGEKGILCFITSNKWMRAGYGKKPREYFVKQNPLTLIDLGPGVFESATVDTNILIIQKSENQFRTMGVTLKKADNGNIDIADYLKNKGFVLSNLSKNAWFIGSRFEQKLKKKIEKIGKPLKEWDVNIYRGVLTGLNKAFIIDTATKEKLCNKDSKSAEIIKPILRGRDIKRYRYDWDGLWLIASGYNIDIPKLYPEIYKHLLQFEKKAKKRDDQGENWWNLRACSYYSEFEKKKVVWKALSLSPCFCYIEKTIFHNDKANILTSKNNDLIFLCGYLNSKLFQFYFSKIGVNMGKGFEYKIQFLNQVPIPPITPKNQPIVTKVEKLVDKIIELKKLDPSVDTSAFEEQIDKLVYKLYNLTDEEINIIEGKEK